MKYPDEVLKLVEAFSKYPGIGEKTAFRLAVYAITKQPTEEIDEFISSLAKMKNLKRCKCCGNLTVNDICEICSDKNRDQSMIMVVEDITGLFAIEKTNSYQGVYHVLDGVINFASGIGPEDINISSLFERENIKEVILATNITVEGEITASYINEMFKDKGIKITKIAHGLPVGGNLEYADSLTLMKALEGRRKIEE